MIPEIVQQWLPYVLALGPAIAALAGVIAAICKLFKAFREFKEDLKNNAEIKELRAMYKQTMEDNAELRKQIRILTNKVDKIKE